MRAIQLVLYAGMVVLLTLLTSSILRNHGPDDGDGGGDSVAALGQAEAPSVTNSGSPGAAAAPVAPIQSEPAPSGNSGGLVASSQTLPTPDEHPTNHSQPPEVNTRDGLGIGRDNEDQLVAGTTPAPQRTWTSPEGPPTSPASSATMETLPTAPTADADTMPGPVHAPQADPVEPAADPARQAVADAASPPNRPPPTAPVEPAEPAPAPRSFNPDDQTHFINARDIVMRWDGARWRSAGIDLDEDPARILSELNNLAYQQRPWVEQGAWQGGYRYRLDGRALVLEDVGAPPVDTSIADTAPADPTSPAADEQDPEPPSQSPATAAVPSAKPGPAAPRKPRQEMELIEAPSPPPQRTAARRATSPTPPASEGPLFRPVESRRIEVASQPAEKRPPPASTGGEAPPARARTVMRAVPATSSGSTEYWPSATSNRGRIQEHAESTGDSDGGWFRWPLGGSKKKSGISQEVKER